VEEKGGLGKKRRGKTTIGAPTTTSFSIAQGGGKGKAEKGEREDRKGLACIIGFQLLLSPGIQKKKKVREKKRGKEGEKAHSQSIQICFAGKEKGTSKGGGGGGGGGKGGSRSLTTHSISLTHT